MKVEILEYTPQPERLVSMAAKLCYTESTVIELHQRLEQSDVKEFINKLLKMGHLSPFEHISFTFGIEDISRVTSHQLVRHRIASYSQQSQRYVKFKEIEYIIPAAIIKDKNLKQKFIEKIQESAQLYEEMVKSGIAAEDARYILPNAATTKIIVTMNGRALLHFFSLRCCQRAQWEIRALADEMLVKVKDLAPTIFALAGPGCMRGPCPEGKFSCGNPKKVHNQ